MKTLEQMERDLGPDQIAKLYIDIKAKWDTVVQDRTIKQRIQDIEKSKPGTALEKIQYEILRALLADLGSVLDPDDYPPVRVTVKARSEEKFEILINGLIRFAGKSEAMTRIIGYFGTRQIVMQHVGKFYYQYGDG